MKHNLKQNLPVLTADQYKLGQTHTLYHREETAEPNLKLFNSYLMVVSLTIGDDYYVPTTYIDEARSDATAVWLTLTRAEIKDKQFTVLPQFIVNNQFIEEKLNKPEVQPDLQRGKPFSEVMPLPQNLSAEENPAE